MRERKLRSVRSNKIVGAVRIDDDGTVHFDEYAQDVFRLLREKEGDDLRVATALLDGGWSNGVLYLEPEPPTTPEIGA